MEYNTEQILDPASALIFGIYSLKKSNKLLFIIYYPFSYIWLVTVAQIDFAEQCGSRILVYKKKHRLRLV